MRRVPILLIVFMTAATLAAQEPPSVVVTFRIEAAQFLNPDLEPQKASIESAVTARLRQLAAQHHPFVSWDGAPPVANVLTVRMIEQPGAADMETLIQYSASIGGRAALNPPVTRKLYDWFAEKPTHDPERLKLHLLQAVEAHFADPEFERAVQKRFLNAVPIATQVRVFANDKQILVPVAPATMPAARDSVLRVDFENSGTPGFLMVTPLLARGNEGFQGPVSTLTFSDLRLVDQWNDRLPSVLRSPQKLAVFVEEFRLDSNRGTSGGRVERLDP